MTRLPRILLIVTTMLVCVGCDQASKLAAQTHLARGVVISLLGDTVRLQYVENPGAFLGLGGALPGGVRHALLIVAVATALIGILVGAVVVRRMQGVRVVALALICGGGVGNLADRLLRDGRVVDFLNLGVGPLRTGVFNVADVALLAGVGLLVFVGSGSGGEVKPRRAAPPPPACPPTAPA